MEAVEVVVQHQFGENKMHTEFWWRKVEERDCLKDQSIDGKTQLKWIYQRSRMGGCGLDSCDLGQGQVTVCCEHGNENSDFLQWEDYLTLSGNTDFLDGFCSVKIVCWLLVPNNNNNNNK